MTKYLLHGGFTRRENDHNRSFFEEFLKDIQENANILLVLFASAPNEVDEKFSTLRDILTKYAGGKQLNFIKAELPEFEEQLARAEAVFFQGGNTDKILKALDDIGDLQNKLKGKTVAGSSAGAYALATYGAAHTSDNMRNGLSVLPVRLVCHFESLDHPPTMTSLLQVEEVNPDLELIYLKDCEWVQLMAD
jgi:peptidase E